MANLINIFNPGNALVIGGPLARTGDYILQPIRTRHSEVLPSIW